MNRVLYSNLHVADPRKNFFEEVQVSSFYHHQHLSCMFCYVPICGLKTTEQRRFGICEDLHQHSREDPNFMSRIVTRDENEYPYL